MSKNYWKKVEEIFPQIADLPPAEGEARLRELCGGDEDLWREIRDLLGADLKVGDFCEIPPVMPSSMSQFSRKVQTEKLLTLELSGEQIGSYRVLRKLGAGGMGAVYLAERADGEFHKKAAIKLVKQGSDTDFNLRRFRHEP